MISVKNSFKSLGIVAGLFAAICILLSAPALLKAATSYVSFQTTGVATTTAGIIFLAPGTTGATSTYQIDGLASGKVQEMGEIDAMQLSVEFVASSSASQLGIQQQVSNNNVDWYNVNQTPVVVAGTNPIGNTVTVATSTTYVYSPGASATSSVSFTLVNPPAKHERLVFFIPPGAANGGYYAEIDLKRLPTNP